MNKIYLIAHQGEKDKILSLLQQTGMVEINDLQTKEAGDEEWVGLVDADEEQERLHELEDCLGNARFALDFLNNHYPEKKGMLDSFGGGKQVVSFDEFVANAQDLVSKCQDVYREICAIDEKLIALRNEETRLQNLKLQLSPWEKLDVPLEEIHPTNAVHMEIGTLPVAEMEGCRQRIAEDVPEAYLETISTDRSEASVFLAYPRSCAEAAHTVLKEHNFSKQTFTGFTGTPAENLSRIEKEMAGNSKQREEMLSIAKEQLENREHLKMNYDYLTMERDKRQVVSNFARTGNSFILEGWIREDDLPSLKNKLAACETAEVLARPPLAGEVFPVALENVSTVAPFEFVTQLYGTPHPRGIDPTFAMTPFFVMFFGLCMTDAGYGIITVLLAALGLKKLKMGPAGRKLLWVLLAGGISTIFFGALLGAWFGGLVPLRPFFFDALEDPMRMLIWALGIGMLHIFFGMGIQFYRNVRKGKVFDALFDQGLWYLLIIGLLLFVFPDFAHIARPLSIGAAIGLVLTQGRHQTGIIKKFFAGLLSLYNITGILSDVLSYSRLLALGLATGIIALAINTMAGLLGGSVIGYFIMAILLIAGHTFNLAINSLGSFIHSARLQYIEFYNRFYESGGKAFMPFSIKTRHVDIMPD